MSSLALKSSLRWLTGARSCTAVRMGLRNAAQNLEKQPDWRQSVYSSQTIPDLVKTASRQGLFSTENALVVLRRACDLMQANAKLTEQPTFSKGLLEKLVKSVHEDMHVLSFDQLNTVVAFSICFSLPGDSRLWQSVEQQVLFILPKLDINQLISLVKTFDAVNVKSQPVHGHFSRVSAAATQDLRQRLSEITRPADLLFALYKFHPPHAPAVVCRELNDRLIGCLGRMTKKQLYRAFYIQTRLESRHTPLLRALAYHLRQPGSLDGLSPNQLLNCLYTCSVLRVSEPRFVRSIVDQVKKKYNEFSQENMVALARSLGSLQLRDVELLAKLLQSGLKESNKLLLAHSIISAGVIGEFPESDVLPEDLVANELSGTAESEPALYLQLVWSLFSIGHDKNIKKLNQLVSPIFSNATFIEKLLKNKQGKPVSENALRRIRLQMANIQELLKLEHPDVFSVFKFAPELAIPTGDCRLRSERPQFELCQDTLAGFCDMKKYVNVDKSTAGGICIDYVVYTDKSGELVPVESHVQDSPYRAIAIKVCEFADQTLLDGQPNGLSRLQSRIHGLHGNAAVCISTSQLSRTMPMPLRVKNLQDIIKRATVTDAPTVVK